MLRDLADSPFESCIPRLKYFAGEFAQRRTRNEVRSPVNRAYRSMLAISNALPARIALRSPISSDGVGKPNDARLSFQNRPTMRP